MDKVLKQDSSKSAFVFDVGFTRMGNYEFYQAYLLYLTIFLDHKCPEIYKHELAAVRYIPYFLSLGCSSQTGFLLH
jgi:hypothetical protein